MFRTLQQVELICRWSVEFGTVSIQTSNGATLLRILHKHVNIGTFGYTLVAMTEDSGALDTMFLHTSRTERQQTSLCVMESYARLVS